MILLGILIGIFIGGCVGVIIMALMSIAKEADRHIGAEKGENHEKQKKNHVNKQNEKNIYCAHCKHWNNGVCMHVKYYVNKQPHPQKAYYQRCKDFVWREDIIDTSVRKRRC